MTVLIHIDEPVDDAQAIKEALAMDCEKYGRGVRVLEVREDEGRQESIWNVKRKP